MQGAHQIFARRVIVAARWVSTRRASTATVNAAHWIAATDAAHLSFRAGLVGPAAFGESGPVSCFANVASVTCLRFSALLTPPLAARSPRAAGRAVRGLPEAPVRARHLLHHHRERVPANGTHLRMRHS